jgi:hypothetical protein
MFFLSLVKLEFSESYLILKKMSNFFDKNFDKNE